MIDIIESFEAYLPPHKCGLTIEHNAHKQVYESVAEYVSGWSDDNIRWVSPEEREKAIATDEIWEMQWYPDTPVGFCHLRHLYT